MSTKTFKTRIKNKIDTDSANQNFLPLKGEIVIGITSSDGASNTAASPFVMKIGDGQRHWKDLPSIGPSSFKTAATNAAGVGDTDGDQVITVSLPSDRRGYASYSFGRSEDFTFSVNIVRESSDYMHADHYLLLDNSEGVYDKKLAGVTVDGVAKVYVQDTSVMIGETAEMKISIWKNAAGDSCATVTVASGIIHGGDF